MERERLVSEMKRSRPAPGKKSGRLIVGILVCSLLMGVSFCFLLDTPAGFIALFMARKPEVPADGRPLEEQCDLFTGEWIQDPSGPAYTNASCNLIEGHHNCMKNGRPDTLYLYWRWKPHGCDIPPFNAEKFMNAMRDKSWAAIGDSIFRNHMESLICLVSKVEEAVEVSHEMGYKSKTWYFPSHNFTLAVIWAPFLVKIENSEIYDPKTPFELHLDVLDQNWTSVYHKYDYVMISGGQWFLKTLTLWEKGSVVGCNYCGPGDLKNLGLGYPYHKALELALRFIATSDHKPLVIFRTWPPSHYEYGEWFNGGVCNRTLPYKEGEFSGKPTDNMMWDIEVEEFEKAAAIGSKNGVRMKLLDTFHLSLLRPDGHPGRYRGSHRFFEEDCLHWCVPGPVDHWNDILMQMLLAEGEVRDTARSLEPLDI